MDTHRIISKLKFGRYSMKNRHFKWYRDWSIKQKLLIIMTLLILFSVMLVSFLSYYRYSGYFTEQTKQQTQQIIEQIGINVDTYLNELFRLSLAPYYNDSIMAELETRPMNEMEKLDKQRTMESFLGSVMILPREDILRVYILTESDVYSNIKTPYDMADYFDYLDTDWYRQAISTQNQIFIPVHLEKVFGNTKTQIFSVVQGLRSKENSATVLGVIKVDANYEGIKTICDKVELQKDSALLIMDDDKNIIYQNSSFRGDELGNNIYDYALSMDGSGITTINGSRYVVNVSTLNTTNWKIVAVHSYTQLNQYFLQTRNVAFLLALLCSAMAVVVLLFFAQSFLNPLFHVVKRMKQVQNGDLTVQVQVKNHDEIGYLTESFNTMVSRIKAMMSKNTQLVKEVYETRYLQKESQYNVLCSQIKPHFLYNTLNTISLLIKCGDQNQAVLDIEKLSFFLRGVMNSDKEIPLSAELKIVDSYLGLQKSRYGKKLTYLIDVPDCFMAYQIPALTLQPIVENAVVHGCENKREKSSINLYCTTENDCLLIHVEDNGKGIDEIQLEELNRSFREEALDDQGADKNDIFTESIGLTNVNSRLQLKFGAEYGISIVSKIDAGTSITLRLPLHPKERGSDHVFRDDC